MSVPYESPYKGIVYFPEVIPNIQSLIERIEELEGPGLTEWHTWYAYGTEGDPYGEIKYMVQHKLSEEQDPVKKESTAAVQKALIDAMLMCAEEYANIHSISSTELEFAKRALKEPGTKFGINKYFEGQFMGPHVDWNEFNSDITYTIVVYLNDNYEGGELFFVDPSINLKIKPKAGSIVMFPSVLPYLHQSCQVVSGRKMLITHHWKNDSLSKDRNVSG